MLLRRTRWTREEEESVMRAGFVREIICIPGRDYPSPVSQTNLGFILDRDYKVQGTNDRDLKFGVHFGKLL
jgi:hypothetical protein